METMRNIEVKQANNSRKAAITQKRARLVSKAFESLKKFKKENPFPEHIAGQIGLITAESGKLMQCGLDVKYGSPVTPEAQSELKENLERQAWRTLAATLRFIEQLEKEK